MLKGNLCVREIHASKRNSKKMFLKKKLYKRENYTLELANDRLSEIGKHH
jgi:hypothetical protein